MRKFLLLGLLTMGILVSDMSAQNVPNQSRPGPQIVTSAVGTSTVVPDRASLQVAVETRASTAAEAGSSNAQLQQRVIGAIVGKGIQANRISTSGYSIYPNERRGTGGERLSIEYVARNTVSVDLERLDQLGGVIDAALGAGANVISSINLYSSKQEEARRSAMEDAIRKARADAEVLAKAAGGSLGNPIEITTGADFSPRLYSAVAMERAATPIAAGEQDVSVTVTVRWALIIGS